MIDPVELLAWFIMIVFADLTSYAIYGFIAWLAKKRGKKLRGHKVLKKHIRRLMER